MPGTVARAVRRVAAKATSANPSSSSVVQRCKVAPAVRHAATKATAPKAAAPRAARAVTSADDRWDWPGPQLPVASTDDRWVSPDASLPPAPVSDDAEDSLTVLPWLTPRPLSDYHGMSCGKVLEVKLREYGVTHVFGYTGGAVLPVTDAFHGSPIQFVNNANEGCCGHAAEGYAKAGGGSSTGVVMATSGPGVTNLVTPLQDALTDTVPLIAFCGQVPRAAVGTDAFQECPTIEITKACTKWNYQIQSANEFPSVVDEAFRVAHEGKKGPVLIDMPKDVALQIVDSTKETVPVVAEGPRVWCPSTVAKCEVKVSDEDIRRAADLINIAERPVIIAGNGALHAAASVRKLSAKAGIPVTTTLHGMGIADEADPLALNMLGMHGAAYANYAVQQSDLIIALGYRFDDRTTGNLKNYAPEAKRAEKEGRGGFIHVEIEQRQIDKIVPSTVGIRGDCYEVLQRLTPLVSRRRRALWRETVAALKERNPFRWDPPEDDQRFKLQQVLSEIQTYLTEVGRDKDVYWSTGVGNHQMMSCQFIRWRWPRRMISSGSLGTMGVGLPFAIGAQMRHPDKMVIDVDGDGSFNMSSNDLRTLAAHNLPVKVALMNDFRQQMVHIWQTLYFEQRYMVTENHNPDYVALAEAHGVKGMRCESAADLPAKVREFIDHKGPVVCDFRIVPDMCTPMVAPGAALDDMILDPSEVMRLDRDPTLTPG